MIRFRRDHAESTARILRHRADNTGKKYKRHKERGPDITPETLMKAIRGSLGMLKRVARRLHVTPQAVRQALLREGFEECANALVEEREGIVDEAETTLQEMVKQREEYGTALRASRFILQTRGKDRGWRNEVTIQGGESPLKVQTTPVGVVSIDSLDLPLEVRLKILEQLEAKSMLTEPEIKRPKIKVRRITED